MSVHKTILIAHHHPDVRARFAAALADARHAYVMADTAAAAERAAADRTAPVNLALVDLGLADDGVALAASLRRASGPALPLLVFSGSVTAGAQVKALAELGISGYVNEHAATPHILPALAPHLFPDSFDRRASRRVKLGVPVSIQAGGKRAAAHALNLSKGGVAIRTMDPLPVGTAIELKFRLPGIRTEIKASGKVRWSDPRTGMGVQFDELGSAAQTAIEQYVE